MVTHKQSAGVLVTSIGVFFLLSVLIYYFNRDAFTSVMVSFLLSTFYYLLAISNDTRNDLFHPYSYFIIMGGIVPFGLPAVVVAVNQDLFMRGGLSADNLAVVSFMVAAFFIMYVAGYMLPVGQKLAQAIPLFGFPKQLSRKRLVSTAIVLYGIGWLARIMAFGLGSHHINPDLGEALTLVSSVLAPLSIFSALSFMVLIWDKFSRAKKKDLASLFSPLVLVLIALEVMAGMLDGSRSRMIIPLVYVAIVYNYTFSRFKWRHMILGIVILVGILAPVTSFYRHAYSDVLKEDGASLEGAIASLDYVVESRVEGQFENEILVMAARLSSMLEGALVVYDKVPSQVDYAEGGTFFPSALFNFVPRLLWPDKPVYIPGREFAQTFWNMEVGERYGTNMDISSVGEAYYNFGWLGLFIAVPLGVVLRVFSERLATYSRIEVNIAPRIYFALFIVPTIGAFHYYPSNVLRGALFILLYLSILNHGIPRVLRLRNPNATRRRLTNNL